MSRCSERRWRSEETGDRSQEKIKRLSPGFAVPLCKGDIGGFAFFFILPPSSFILLFVPLCLPYCSRTNCVGFFPGMEGHLLGNFLVPFDKAHGVGA